MFVEVGYEESPQMSGNRLTHFKSNLNKGVVVIKWYILITVEESSFYMIKHLNLARFESRASAQE